MPNKPPRDLQERVEQAANAILKASGSAGPIELMLQLGWLAPSHFVSWKKGTIPSVRSKNSIRTVNIELIGFD
jgi:hypothetical protein